MAKPNITELVKISKEVFADCSMENGAIVAANPGKLIYSPRVQNYGFVWIRDAAYICIAADLLGQKNIPERFFDWCLNKAEDFKNTGLFYNAYNVNGTIHGTLINPGEVKVPQKTTNKYLHITHHGSQFQPDQNGLLLIAIGHHIKHFSADKSSGLDKLVEKTASGISNSWKIESFYVPYFDLWEERCILPMQKRHHIYSLAMCISGLRTAIKLLGKRKNWLQTEQQMLSAFEQMYSSNIKTIPRTYSTHRTPKDSSVKRKDNIPDSSLLGLVYPSGILDASDKKMIKTVEQIIKSNIVDNGGLLRYSGDKYCGGIQHGWVTLKGAGAWPLLNFWIAIYYCLLSDKKKAEKYFYWPLRKINRYIPEQIFTDQTKQSISPLAWSHAMFIIAAKHLGYI